MKEKIVGLSECRRFYAEIGERIADIAGRIAEIVFEQMSLDEAGRFESAPSESWESREGKGSYLRLVFRTNGGKRRKIYVGCDPAKIEAAREKMGRSERHRALELERSRLCLRFERALYHLRNARYELGSQGQ